METNQRAPGLNRGLSSNILWLRTANDAKFPEECVILQRGMNDITGKAAKGVEAHWLSSKKNVLGSVISKQRRTECSGTWKDRCLLIPLKKVQL